MAKQRVGVVFGGRSVEHEVSINSARTVAQALAQAGHEVVPLGIAPDGCWLSPAGGRASAVAMDKLQAKRLLAAAGVPVVEFRATTRVGFEADPQAFLHRCAELPLPLFVKPSVGGSSVGVQKVKTAEALEAAVRLALRFDDQVLVERGVQGRELE